MSQFTPACQKSARRASIKRRAEKIGQVWVNQAAAEDVALEEMKEKSGQEAGSQAEPQLHGERLKHADHVLESTAHLLPEKASAQRP